MKFGAGLDGGDEGRGPTSNDCLVDWGSKEGSYPTLRWEESELLEEGSSLWDISSFQVLMGGLQLVILDIN